MFLGPLPWNFMYSLLKPERNFVFVLSSWPKYQTRKIFTLSGASYYSFTIWNLKNWHRLWSTVAKAFAGCYGGGVFWFCVMTYDGFWQIINPFFGLKRLKTHTHKQKYIKITNNAFVIVLHTPQVVSIFQIPNRKIGWRRSTLPQSVQWIALLRHLIEIIAVQRLRVYYTRRKPSRNLMLQLSPVIWAVAEGSGSSMLAVRGRAQFVVELDWRHAAAPCSPHTRTDVQQQ